MADTNDLAQYGLIAALAFIGYKAMSGIGQTATAPARFAADLIGGGAGAVGDVFGGTMNTADNLGDWAGGVAGGAGEVVNSTLAVPGDLVDTGQGAFDTAVGGTTDVLGDAGNAVGSTVDNLNPFS